MLKFLSKILLLLSLFFFVISCEKTKEEEYVIENPKPKVIDFGFNLNEFNVVNDTIKSGDTFIGNLILPLPLLITLLIKAEYSVVICLSSKERKFTNPITSSYHFTQVFISFQPTFPTM